MAAYLLRVDSLERGAARERQERTDVPGVIGDGMRAQTAFVGEVLQIAAQERVRGALLRFFRLGVSAHLQGIPLHFNYLRCRAKAALMKSARRFK